MWFVFLAAFLICLFGKRFSLLLGFFDGLFLAFMCFCFLPVLLEGEFFWINSMLLVLGVLASCTVFLTAVLVFYYVEIKAAFLFSLLSGLFLLVACGGILPEEHNAKRKMKLAILGMAGFLIGILLIFPIE